MKAYERLLKYVAINTPCDETSNTTPSSKCQFDLANLLKDEMQSLGVSVKVKKVYVLQHMRRMLEVHKL